MMCTELGKDENLHFLCSHYHSFNLSICDTQLPLFLDRRSLLQCTHRGTGGVGTITAAIQHVYSRTRLRLAPGSCWIR